MKESKIENEVCKYAKNLDWLCYKFSSPGNKAVPDRIFLKQGVIVFIEFKSTGKQPSKLQAKVIKRIRDEEFKVYVIDNVTEGYQVFEQF